ncbi:MAG: invasion associated locus B family protein [Alphaproteobacteria bacterium]
MTNRRFKWLDWRGLCAATCLALATTALPTQNAVAQEADDPWSWTKVCNADPATGEEGCAVVYRVLANETTILMQFSLRYFLSDPNAVIASIWIPTGVFVDQGLLVTVDDQESGVIVFRLCDAQICIAEDQVDLAFVNMLKAGLNLQVSFIVPSQTEGARRVDLDASLVGFTAIFDGPGVTPDEAAAQQDAVNEALQQQMEETRQRLIEQQQQLNAEPTPAP